MDPKCSGCGGVSEMLIGLARFSELGAPVEKQPFVLNDEGCQSPLCSGCMYEIMTAWNRGDFLPRDDE